MRMMTRQDRRDAGWFPATFEVTCGTCQGTFENTEVFNYGNPGQFHTTECRNCNRTRVAEMQRVVRRKMVARRLGRR